MLVWRLLALSLVASACLVRAPGLDSGPRAKPFGSASEPSLPAGEASEEATSEQLALARDEGKTVDAAIRYLLSEEALSGADVRAGDYRITVALTPLEGTVSSAPRASAVPPFHLFVAVTDAYDGRVVPELEVAAKVLDAHGDVLAARALPFVWHPVLCHYGVDLALAKPGPYRVLVSVAPARMRRHDPTNGDRYDKPASADVAWLTTDRRVPPADARARLQLARAQGAAYRRALATMSDGVAVDGASQRSGDYVIAYAVEFAEGYFYLDDSGLHYAQRVDESSETNAHVEVSVLDAETGRFVPGLTVTATLYKDGERVGAEREPFMWHPWVYHYGMNWRVPGAGRYVLEVAFERPPYAAAAADGSPRFTSGGRARFEAVELAVGQK
jgi:hypothetical protein